MTKRNTDFRSGSDIVAAERELSPSSFFHVVKHMGCQPFPN